MIAQARASVPQWLRGPWQYTPLSEADLKCHALVYSSLWIRHCAGEMSTSLADMNMCPQTCSHMTNIMLFTFKVFVGVPPLQVMGVWTSPNLRGRVGGQFGGRGRAEGRILCQSHSDQSAICYRLCTAHDCYRQTDGRMDYHRNSKPCSQIT